MNEEKKKEFEEHVKKQGYAFLTETDWFNIVWQWIDSELKQARIDENKFHKERYRFTSDGEWRADEIFNSIVKPFDERIKELEK